MFEEEVNLRLVEVHVADVAEGLSTELVFVLEYIDNNWTRSCCVSRAITSSF